MNLTYCGKKYFDDYYNFDSEVVNQKKMKERQTGGEFTQ